MVHGSICLVPHRTGSRPAMHPAHLQSLHWFKSGGTTRSCVRLLLARSTLFVNSPFFSSYSTWLQLPPSVRQAPDMPKFRTLVRPHFSISLYTKSQSPLPLHSSLSIPLLCKLLIPSHFVYVLFIFFFLFFRGWSHPLLNSIGCLDMPRGAEINK